MSNILNMKIAGRPIGSNHKPYIIAEMSANHNGSIDRAFKIIDEAVQIFKKNKWPTIDVTRKSVEETAASVIKIYEIKNKNA